MKKAARGLPQLLRIVVGVVDSSSQEFGPRLLSVSVTEWLRSPPLDQQVDLEGLGSNPGAVKLDSGFQLSVK